MPASSFVPPSATKRRRKVLSCSECRRRKLQCDRAQPACSRCLSSRKHCTYLHRNPSSLVTGADGCHPAVHLVPAAIDAETRTKDSSLFSDHSHQRARYTESSFSDGIGCSLRRESASPGAGIDLHDDHQPLTKVKESINIRGGSWKNEFHGFTCASSMIGLVPGLLSYAREAYDMFPAIDVIRHRLQDLETRTLVAPTRSQIVTDQELIALLPPHAEVERLTQIYFENLDCIYHIIHRSSFDKQYAEFRLAGEQNDVLFVALVLLIVASALYLTTTTGGVLVDNADAARDAANVIITSCERWLQTTNLLYNRLVDFQISFLILVSRQLSGRQRKRTWADCGKLIRDFMHAGLHRDPDLLAEAMPLQEKEIRKRLWRAAIEFDLQAAFGQGMAAASWPSQSDSPPPSNASDLEFELQRSVQTELGEVFTQSSYLAVAGRSTVVRHELNNLLNNVHRPLDFLETKAFTEKLEHQLDSLPEWGDGQGQIVQALLRLNIHQFLLALHVRQAQQAKTSAEARFSRILVVESAVDVVNLHKGLPERCSHALELLYGHLTRTALSVCYVYCTETRSGLCSAHKPLIQKCMADAVSKIKHNTSRYGGDQRQLWVTIAATSFMSLDTDPQSRLQCMRNSVEDFVSIFNESVYCGHSTLDQHVCHEDASADRTVTGFGRYGCDDERLMTTHDDFANTLSAFNDLNGMISDDWLFDTWLPIN